MIVRHFPNTAVITTQIDHALASGEIARVIQPEYLDKETSDVVIRLVSRHDDGWIEWERNPQTHPSGEPINFTDIPAAEHDEIWNRGIDIMHRELGPFAAAVLARHAQSLVTSEGTVDQMTAHILTLLKEAMPNDDPAVRDWRIERAFYFLQFCDLLTLIVCAGWTKPYPMTLLESSGQRLEITAQRRGDWEIELDQWPFRTREVTVPLPIMIVDNGDWSSALAAIQSGRRLIQEVVLRPSPQ